MDRIQGVALNQLIVPGQSGALPAAPKAAAARPAPSTHAGGGPGGFPFATSFPYG